MSSAAVWIFSDCLWSSNNRLTLLHLFPSAYVYQWALLYKIVIFTAGWRFCEWNMPTHGAEQVVLHSNLKAPIMLMIKSHKCSPTYKQVVCSQLKQAVSKRFVKWRVVGESNFIFHVTLVMYALSLTQLCAIVEYLLISLILQNYFW